MYMFKKTKQKNNLIFSEGNHTLEKEENNLKKLIVSLGFRFHLANMF